ncbi:MAG: aspartate--tRNA ligase, partial [Chthonomonadaceae bacterium]|nr:aspartate--tRNA ligase [Chthonomonadaceae bacterium]
MNRQRDFGDLVFIDLRDRTGIVQVVIDRKDASSELVTLANSVRSEFVLSVKGKVRRRTPGAENPNLKTGEIEIAVTSL